MDEPAAPVPPAEPARWATIAWIACSVLLVAFVVGIWMRVGADRAGSNLTNAIIAGERPVAPALPSTELERSGARGLPTPEGEILVVNWWASWCGPCIEEADVLRDVAEDYEGRVTVVGLNPAHKDGESDARAFVKQYDLRSLVILRAGQADEDAWGVNSKIPSTYVVGTDGRISSFVTGQVDDETLRGLVDAELDERRSA